MLNHDDKFFDCISDLNSAIKETIVAQKHRTDADKKIIYTLIFAIIFICLMFSVTTMYTVSKQFDYEGYPQSNITNNNSANTNKE